MSNYPFPAVIGHEKAKKALMLLSINPGIGSVLLIGKLGSEETGLLHSFKELIVSELKGCGTCIDIPTNCTADRLLGGISFEDAIQNGEKKLEKGLLSMSNGGNLFIDQIHFLPNQILNCIFSVQENKRLILEREGISYEEPLDYSIFASMNSEEASLSGAQLDHIGITVKMDEDGEQFKSCDDSQADVYSTDSEFREKENLDIPIWRAEKLKKRMEYEINPSAFCRRYEDEKKSIVRQLERARKLLSRISLTREHFLFISDLITAAACPGHRGEIVLCEVSRAIAAYRGSATVERSDMVEAAEYTLPHRMKNPMGTVDFSSVPFEGENKGEETQENREEYGEECKAGDNCDCGGRGEAVTENSRTHFDKTNTDAQTETGNSDQVRDDEPKENGAALPSSSDERIAIFSGGVERKKSPGYGRRRYLVSNQDRGREVGSCTPKNRVRDLSMMATLRAAVSDDRRYEHIDGEPMLKIRAEHLREKKRESTGGARILFLVDGSASMGAYKRMDLVKQVVYSILGDSYVHRDFVAVMIFKGRDARLALPFTRSMARARKCLETLRTGGRTPLILGLREALRFLKLDAVRNKNPRHELVLVSDGKNNVLPDHMDFEESLADIRRKLDAEKVGMTVIDTESGFMRLGYAKKISEKLDARYFSIDKREA